MRKFTIPALANRDPSTWKIVSTSKEVDDDDPYVEFAAGEYVSSTGIRIPITFKCYKSGIIYKAWLKEMEKREKTPKIDDDVIDIEAELIDIEAAEGKKLLPRKLKDEESNH
jgi:hypothetical protein